MTNILKIWLITMGCILGVAVSVAAVVGLGLLLFAFSPIAGGAFVVILALAAFFSFIWFLAEVF